MKIALVSYTKEKKLSIGLAKDEDEVLLDYLIDKGINSQIVIWNDAEMNWSQFDLLIIKSTWDYHNNLDQFHHWLDKIEALGIQVLNSVEVIKWNSNKKYLQEIKEFGLPVIASEYLLQGSQFDEHLFEFFQTQKVVVKPCVSAGAQHTMIIDKNDFQENLLRFNQLLQDEEFIVQPFISEIKEGEWSFLYFNGKFSHCVLKTPKAGDFRVQQHHGGDVNYPKAKPEQIDQAAKYLAILSEVPLYARIDGVIINDKFQLMELELIEPYLFLNANESLLDNYYQAILEKLNQ